LLCGWTTSIALAGAHLLAAADGHGQLGRWPASSLILAFQRGSLVAARLVLPDRLVDRHGNLVTASMHDRLAFLGCVACRYTWSLDPTGRYYAR
jgi:hypothetical protein